MKFIRRIANRLFSHLYKGVKVGNDAGLRIWKSVKCTKNSHIQLGNVSVRDNCHIEAKDGGNIVMGDNVNFNYNCIVAAHKRVYIGSNVSIGPNVLIYDHDHNYKSADWRKNFISDDVVIGNNVWIGGNVVILRGTIIDDGCVIGAGTLIKGEHIAANTLRYEQLLMTCKNIVRE